MAFSSMCTLVSLWPFPKQCFQSEDRPALYPVDLRNLEIAPTGLLSKSAVFGRATVRILEAIQAHGLPIAPHTIENSLLKLEASLDENEASEGESPDIPLQYGVDESYTIEIKRVSPDSDVLRARLRAKTIYGAMHGLQTFSQLIERSIKNEAFVAEVREIEIVDEPKFPHRGMLLDTSRHYESVPTIKKAISLLAMNKLNVFHWHIVDIQSYPIEGPQNAGEKNWLDGAYDLDQIYTMQDVQELRAYAEDRGVRIVPEFDMPGHTDSWGKSHPELFPAKCNATSKQPFGALEPKNETYRVIDEMFKFYTSEGFTDEFIHLGGDEVPYNCWEDLVTDTMPITDIFSGFLNSVHQLARNRDKQVIWWDEAFFGLKERNVTLPRNNTIIQVWHTFDMVKVLHEAGFQKVILSPTAGANSWYLDHLDISWRQMYDQPIETLDHETLKKLIGGEGCMWGERVDDSNIFARAFPRMSAIAERLWTFTKDHDPAHRFEHFRCQMITRGFGVGELTHYGDTAVMPAGPSSCVQYADHTTTTTTTPAPAPAPTRSAGPGMTILSSAIGTNVTSPTGPPTETTPTTMSSAMAMMSPIGPTIHLATPRDADGDTTVEDFLDPNFQNFKRWETRTDVVFFEAIGLSRSNGTGFQTLYV